MVASRLAARRAGAVLLAGLLTAALWTPGGTEAGPRRKWERVGPGLHYRLFRLRRPKQKVRVLRFDPARGGSLDVELGNGRLPGLETTSSMASRRGALAAVNGDYARSWGAPVFTFAADGSLVQDPERDVETGVYKYGRNFSLSVDETTAYAANPKTRAWFTGWDGAPVRIERFNNGDPGPDAVAAFTRAGAPAQVPPLDACYVRLRASGPPRTTSSPSVPTNRRGEPIVAYGVEQPHYVDKQVGCRHKRVRPRGGVTLVAFPGGAGEQALASLTPGEPVTLGWSLDWPEVFDTIGGNPTLIERGAVQAQSLDDPHPFVSGRHPRTAVAWRADTRRIFLITVDGRQPGYSVGMSLSELARFCAERLGATDVLNLDGGGSTTMVVREPDGTYDIKGRPSDGRERPVSSALLILPGPDPGEDFSGRDYPSPLRRALGLPPGGVQAVEVWGDMARDPASVGGMADHLARRSGPLPHFLRRPARLFEP